MKRAKSNPTNPWLYAAIPIVGVLGYLAYRHYTKSAVSPAAGTSTPSTKTPAMLSTSTSPVVITPAVGTTSPTVVSTPLNDTAISTDSQTAGSDASGSSSSSSTRQSSSSSQQSSTPKAQQLNTAADMSATGGKVAKIQQKFVPSGADTKVDASPGGGSKIDTSSGATTSKVTFSVCVAGQLDGDAVNAKISLVDGKGGMKIKKGDTVKATINFIHKEGDKYKVVHSDGKKGYVKHFTLNSTVRINNDGITSPSVRIPAAKMGNCR